MNPMTVRRSVQASQADSASWLSEYGPGRLDLLFRAIVFHPSVRVDEAKSAKENAVHLASTDSYALFLLDVHGKIVAWRGDAEHLYGYSSEDVVGKHVSVLCVSSQFSEYSARTRSDEELARAASAGHFGKEGWCTRKAGTRFWANVITLAFGTMTENCRALPASCATLAAATKETRS